MSGEGFVSGEPVLEGFVSGQPGGVRPARERDLDRLSGLFGLLLEHHAAAGPRLRPAAGSEDAVRDWLRGRLREPQTRVLAFEAGTDLSGLCIASLRRRPPVFEEVERGEIEHLFVRAEQRRRGMGRTLVAAAFSWLRAHGVRRVEIQVDRRNVEGRAFWDALGFAAVMDVLERAL